MDRFPLRPSQRRQLNEWIASDGIHKVARLAQVSPVELDQVAAGKVPPTTSERSRLIFALVRQGFDQGLGDPHGPGREGFEHIGGVDFAERLELAHDRAERRERRASRGY